jgi:hypothetical protein
MTEQRMICCPGELLDRPDDAVDRAFYGGFLRNAILDWDEAVLALSGGTPREQWLPTTSSPELWPPIARFWPVTATQSPRPA